MARVLETSTDDLSAVLWTTCRDRWFVLVATGFVLGSAIVLGTGDAIATLAAPTLGVVLAVLVAAQAFVVRRGIRESREQRFWHVLGLAIGCWALAEALDALDGANAIAGLGLDLARFLVYVLLLAAAEHHPHLHGPWRPSPAEHRLRWPAVVLLVTGWTLYYNVVPWVVAGRPASPSTVVLGWLSLDALVALRYTLLARRADVWRWRRLYDVLAIAMSLGLLATLIRTGWLLDDAPSTLSVGLRAAPMVAVSFALALSRRRLPPRLTAGPATSGLARLAGGQAGVLAAWALLVPAIHGFSYGLGLLAEPFRALREALVVGGVLTLGAAAVWEHQLRRRRLLSARHDQRSIEDTLRTREQDLRLILERRRGRDELRRSEEQFVSAFRASPDGLAISTLEDGRILDVNPSFARIVGRSADDLVGHEVASLGLWPELEGRSRIVEIVRRDGAVRDMDVSLTLGGRPLRLRVSFEAIQVGADVLLLTVLRDRTEEWRADRPLAVRAGLLDRSAATIRGIGADGRTTYHNQASSRAMLGHVPPTHEPRLEVAVRAGTEAPPAASHPTVRLIFTTTPTPRPETTDTSEPSA